MPAIYLVLTRKAIDEGWLLIEQKLVTLINGPAISIRLQNQFEQFSEQPADTYITYRDVMYQKSLLAELIILTLGVKNRLPFQGSHNC